MSNDLGSSTVEKIDQKTGYPMDSYGNLLNPISSWVSLPDEWDPCPECTDKGLCPHCGKPLDNPDEPVKCSHCGWEEGQSEGIPGDGPGCLCPDLYLGLEDF